METENQGGEISRNLFTLQLQIKTLLEGAGGDQALEMLDELSSLNPSEQSIIIKVFSRMISRIASGEVRLTTASDEERKEFEEELYQSIVNSLKSGRQVDSRRKNLQVLDGGRSQNTVRLRRGKRPRRADYLTVLN